MYHIKAERNSSLENILDLQLFRSTVISLRGSNKEPFRQIMRCFRYRIKNAFMSGSRSFSNNSLSLVHSFYKQFEENRLWRGLVWASGLSLFVVIQVGAFTLFLRSAPTSADKRVHCPSVPSVNRKAVGGNWMRHLVAPTSFVLAPHPSFL